ncbi:MAG TPA: 3-phosphoshikimate 1-carboxyvinyltransferase [bacterium]
MDKTISPANSIRGKVRLPGDKSISHRALMIASIAEGTTEIENLSNGEDVLSTLTCLKTLGVKIAVRGKTTVVGGKGLYGYRRSARKLDVGNSGTTIRLMSGLLAGQPFESTLTGDESIRRRPMSRIVQPLRLMGAKILAHSDEFAPLTIRGGELNPISYHLPVASAQVKSCILLAGLFANGETCVTEPYLTRDHSERMLQNFGAQIERNAGTVTVHGPARLTAQHVYVPGDLSSAAFLMAAAILTTDSQVTIENAGVNPTRESFIHLLIEMGAKIEIMNFANLNNEFFADVVAESSDLKGIKIRGEIIPQIIDEIPILAILATQANGTTEIRGAAELRVKESDRLHAISSNLQRMGAAVIEKEDGLTITGPTKLRSAEIDSFHDHRIAMAFAIAGLIAEGKTLIRDAECAEVSFPGFFETLEEITIG